MIKIIWILIVVFAAVAGGWWYMRQTSPPLTPMSEIMMPTKSAPPAAETLQATVIRYTDAGYIPAAIIVKKGEAVMFKNESAVDMWLASAMHPTHTAYPNTSIARCGMDGTMRMFDACRGLKPGESWSFSFETPGKWGYHDHLHAKHFGSVTVEE